jgi:hypothetical protein
MDADNGIKMFLTLLDSGLALSRASGEHARLAGLTFETFANID